jgi:hypothetical protein
MPGVEDMNGEYCWGDTSRFSLTGCAAAAVPDNAGTTAHVPSTHPQLPAPQSMGPSQLIVQSFALQSGAFALFVQPDGWQQVAGTQSA